MFSSEPSSVNQVLWPFHKRGGVHLHPPILTKQNWLNN